MLFQALNLLTVVASGLMMWKGLCLFTNSESPIVVVLSYVSSSFSHFLFRGWVGLIQRGKRGVPYNVEDRWNQRFTGVISCFS